MGMYNVEVGNGAGDTALMLVGASNRNEAANVADARCAAMRAAQWYPTGRIEQVDPLDYLSATERAAIPAVAAGLRRDGVAVPPVVTGPGGDYRRGWPQF